MASANADDLVLPKPAIPKTLGILDVIFAVILLLAGLCGVAGAVLQGPLQEFGKKALAQANAQANAQAQAQKAADLKALDDREKAATTEAEKAAIAQERAAVEARPDPVQAQVQVNAGGDLFKEPIYQAYTITSLALSLIFNVALLVAGIGLIRLAPGGRTLALWWAGLVIAKLVILAGVHLALIRPMEQKVADANIAALKADADKPNAPPQAAMAAQVAELFAQLGTVFMVAGLLVALIYPTLCLVLLNTRGARAACLPRPAMPPAPGDWGAAP